MNNEKEYEKWERRGKNIFGVASGNTNSMQDAHTLAAHGLCITMCSKTMALIVLICSSHGRPIMSLVIIFIDANKPPTEWTLGWTFRTKELPVIISSIKIQLEVSVYSKNLSARTSRLLRGTCLAREEPFFQLCTSHIPKRLQSKMLNKSTTVQDRKRFSHIILCISKLFHKNKEIRFSHIILYTNKLFHENKEITDQVIRKTKKKEELTSISVYGPIRSTLMAFGAVPKCAKLWNN